MSDAGAVRIGTRGSPLALAQADMVASGLRAQGLAASIVPIVTTGDRIQDRKLLEAGGKGLFTKELDLALEAGEIDCVVHSMKDVPVDLPEGQSLVAFLPREDPREAFISAKADRLEALPEGAKVGTASARRAAQILARRPDLTVDTLRGNVGTRLGRIREGVFDATFLAMAGLTRLKVSDPLIHAVPKEDILPAAGQGIVGIAALPARLSAEALKGLEGLDHANTRLAAMAERAFLKALDGSCRTAMAAHFELTGWGGARMVAEIYSARGEITVRSTGRAMARGQVPMSVEDAAALGLALADNIRAKAGQRLPEILG